MTTINEIDWQSLFLDDVSPDFEPSRYDAQVMRDLLKHEATPKAIRRFDMNCYGMTDYGYWFMLGTLWVSYTGWSDLNRWRKLFSSDRPKRSSSLMKPRELSVFEALPDPIIAYRAHRPGETDWLSLTLSDYKAAQFARLRGVDHIVEYSIPKEAALCLFLRRGEFEVLTLHRERATKRREIAVIYEDEGGVSIAGGAI